MDNAGSPIFGYHTVQQILGLHEETVARWHRVPLDNPYQGLLQVVCQQHQFNYLLWHEEDIARSPRETDSRIAAVKRAIDGYNQQRNDWIEKIDEYLLSELERLQIQAQPQATLNTETPGSAIDRLSIMSLRIFHLNDQLEREDIQSSLALEVQTKLDRCHAQAHDLSESLAELLQDIFAGRKQLKLYRQMKMYNDPRLNPYLYGSNTGP